MKRLTKSICILLVLVMILTMPVHAEEQSARSSSYFAAFQLYIRCSSGTQLKIWFDITGTGMMDKIGVSEILLQRSVNNATWTTVKTYTPEDYPQMFNYNSSGCVNYVTYEGSRYYYYRAYITMYAEKSSGWAEMYEYTSPIRIE